MDEIKESVMLKVEDTIERIEHLNPDNIMDEDTRNEIIQMIHCVRGVLELIALILDGNNETKD